MSTNPLPASSGPIEPGVQLPGGEGIRMIRGIVMSWERLRLVYNLVLLVPGLIFAVLYIRSGMPLVAVIFEAVMFGFGANLCFCLGPYAELVVTGLGYPETGRRLRPLLFGLGILTGLFLMMSWFLLTGLF